MSALSDDRRALAAWRDVVNGEGAGVLKMTRDVLAELVRIAERFETLLIDVVSDLASTECTHDSVYYTWESIVRRADGQVADIIRNASDHTEGWDWDMQLKDAARRDVG